MFSEEEKRELKEMAMSSRLREDMRRLVKMRRNPFLEGNIVDIDKLLAFLTEYNYFINHASKSFRRIIDKDMRL